MFEIGDELLNLVQLLCVFQHLFVGLSNFFGDRAADVLK